jgi:hypothetical protein
MNLKIRPLLIAAGLGGTIQLVLSVVLQSLSIFAFSKSVSETPVPDSFSPILSAVGFANCLCVALLDILVGATYGLVYPREEPLLSGDVILGGGVSAGLARFVSGGLGLVIGLLFLPFIFGQLGLSSADVGMMLTLGLAGGMVCGIFGLIVSALIGGLFGFLGGGIVVLIRERRSGQLSGAGLL